MRIAVMPGSYDPVTLGHVDIIQRASVLFDQVIVAAMINAEKQYCFSAEERISFLKDAVKDLKNVSVEYSERILTTKFGWLSTIENTPLNVIPCCCLLIKN